MTINGNETFLEVSKVRISRPFNFFLFVKPSSCTHHWLESHPIHHTITIFKLNTHRVCIQNSQLLAITLNGRRTGDRLIVHDRIHMSIYSHTYRTIYVCSLAPLQDGTMTKWKIKTSKYQIGNVTETAKWLGCGTGKYYHQQRRRRRDTHASKLW